MQVEGGGGVGGMISFETKFYFYFMNYTKIILHLTDTIYSSSTTPWYWHSVLLCKDLIIWTQLNEIYSQVQPTRTRRCSNTYSVRWKRLALMRSRLICSSATLARRRSSCASAPRLMACDIYNTINTGHPHFFYY